jgi:hypothetical protein
MVLQFEIPTPEADSEHCAMSQSSFEVRFLPVNQLAHLILREGKIFLGTDWKDSTKHAESHRTIREPYVKPLCEKKAEDL